MYNFTFLWSLAQLVEHRTLIRWSSVQIAHDPPYFKRDSYENPFFRYEEKLLFSALLVQLNGVNNGNNTKSTKTRME